MLSVVDAEQWIAARPNVDINKVEAIAYQLVIHITQFAPITKTGIGRSAE